MPSAPIDDPEKTENFKSFLLDANDSPEHAQLRR